ncbi:MAG: ATP-grasp domain-containing protein, partial [Actinomycetes bacterium]
TLQMLGEVVDGAGCDEETLLSLVGAHRPAGIVTFSEFRIESTARLAHRLGLPHHPLEELPAITLKNSQRERFAERGLDTVKAATVTDPAQIDAALAEVGLPAIVKPVRGASSRNTVSVSTARECHHVVSGVLATDGPGPAETSVMLEELLVGRPTQAPWGDYIAVDCVVSNGAARAMFVTSKFCLAPPFRERGGYGGRSIVEDHLIAEVETLACRAVQALGITTGIADVEIKLTAGGPRVIEVNGRLGAWVDDLAVRSGAADPADIAVKSALGRRLDERRPRAEGAPIAFHYLLVPPIDARHVQDIHNVPALRRVPNVDKVMVLTEPGRAAHWRLGATANVAAVVGAVSTHTELADTVATLEEVSWISYR